MAKKIKQVRQHAKKHQSAHQHLKTVLKRTIYREKIAGIFIGTFVIVLLSILIFFNWETILSTVKNWWPEKTSEPVVVELPTESQGYQKGLEASYLINGQTASEYIKQIGKVQSNGFQTGAEIGRRVGLEVNKEEFEASSSSSSHNLAKSLLVSTSLGAGNHLIEGKSQAGKTLQKSLVTSYYLGRKSINLNSILETDLELLSKINNALAVDLFAYLNQSVSRADSLDDYLNLLENLEQSAQKRSTELQSQINFLTSNFEAQERTISTKEDNFFQTIENFNGGQADEELEAFIELQKQQSETRAKIGAYQSLQEYYEFFLPHLSLLIETINANRDPLIAGVRVVEIDNMQLPLIIEE